MSQKEVLNIVDANAYLFKSYNAYDPQLDAKGIDQRVLKGLMDAVLSVISHATRPLSPYLNLPDPVNHFIFIFDPDDGSKYRKELFPQYKMNRPPKEAEFIRQANFALKVLKERVGIPLLIYPGYEADDTVGSLTHLYKDDYKINVYSIDKDLAQLVDDNVTLIRRLKKKNDPYAKFVIYNKEDVFNEFGVYPERIPDFLALVGDTVDNLPGLDGIGPAKASKIIAEYMSVEHLMAYRDQITNKGLKNQIKEYENLLPLVKMLATIKCDLPIEQSFLDSCNFAEKVRSASEYSENFKKMEGYFKWPSHYRDFFTS